MDKGRLGDVLRQWQDRPEDALEAMGKEQVLEIVRNIRLARYGDYIIWKLGWDACIDAERELLDGWEREDSREQVGGVAE